LCFHEEDKLRTVIWDFAGDALSDAMVDGLTRLGSEPPSGLQHLLSPIEFEITLVRAEELLAIGSLPFPDEDGMYPPYPWPLV
jgi:hypothetical protein